MFGAQPDHAEQVRNLFVYLFATGNIVDLHGFADQLAQGHAWVERRIRVLKDHLHVAARLLQMSSIEIRYIDPAQVAILEPDLAGSWLMGAQNDATRGGLATPAFSHKPKRLPLAHLKTHIVNGAHMAHCPRQQAFLNGKMLF